MKIVKRYLQKAPHFCHRRCNWYEYKSRVRKTHHWVLEIRSKNVSVLTAVAGWNRLRDQDLCRWWTSGLAPGGCQLFVWNLMVRSIPMTCCRCCRPLWRSQPYQMNGELECGQVMPLWCRKLSVWNDCDVRKESDLLNPVDPSASFRGHFWDSGNYHQYLLVKIRMFFVFLSVLRLLVSLQGLQHQAEGTKTEFLWLSDSVAVGLGLVWMQAARVWTSWQDMMWHLHASTAFLARRSRVQQRWLWNPSNRTGPCRTSVRVPLCEVFKKAQQSG